MKRQRPFGERHYVAVVRLKPAELGALRLLRAKHRALITPLIEILPTSRLLANADEVDGAQLVFDLGNGGNSNLAANLGQIAKRIGQAWGQSAAWVDLGLLPKELRTPDAQHAIKIFWDAVTHMNLSLTPVVYLDSDGPYRAAISEVAKSGVGACLRIRLEELQASNFHEQLSVLLSDLGVSYGEIDLVIDYGLFHVDQPPFSHITKRLPALRNWRTFTVLCGSFPKNLEPLELGKNYLLRDEWHRWLEQVTGADAILERLPTYGDYTIQYAVYEEPPPFSNPSASIRWADVDYWVVFRGEALRSKNGPGSEQYRGNALLLTELKEFRGEDFCEGERYLFHVATDAIATPGSPMTWLRAGINHHLTLISETISDIVDFAPLQEA